MKSRSARCAWCAKPYSRRCHGGGAEPSTCCSRACGQAYAAHGRSPSKADIAARIAHAARQPKGATSVADFLARGGVIWREDAKPRPVPLRPDSFMGQLMGGRAR